MGEKTMVDIYQSMHDNHLPQELKTISGHHITAKTCRTTGITIKRRKLGLTAQQVQLSLHHKDIRT